MVTLRMSNIYITYTQRWLAGSQALSTRLNQANKQATSSWHDFQPK